MYRNETTNSFPRCIKNTHRSTPKLLQSSNDSICYNRVDQIVGVEYENRIPTDTKIWVHNINGQLWSENRNTSRNFRNTPKLDAIASKLELILWKHDGHFGPFLRVFRYIDLRLPALQHPESALTVASTWR